MLDPSSTLHHSSMDWKTFIASIINSLAWPVIVGAVLLSFRGAISQLVEKLQFDRTKRLAIGSGGLDLEFFDSQIEDVRTALSAQGSEISVSADSKSIAAVSSVDENFIDGVLNASPRAAIIEASIKAEVAFRNVAKRAGYSHAAGDTLSSLLGWLHREALIGTDTYEAGLGLNRTYNEIIQSNKEIDKNRALQFVALVAEVQKRLNRIDFSELD